MRPLTTLTALAALSTLTSSVLLVTPPASAAAATVTASTPASSASAAESASDAAPGVRAPFTARVAALQHALGRITLAGTGRAGTIVTVSGETLAAPTSVVVRADGSWRAVVSGRAGVNAVTVTPAGAAAPLTLAPELLIYPTISMFARVDGWGRSIELEGLANRACARMIVSVDGHEIGRTTAGADASWSYRLTGLSFGQHHVEVEQHFDGSFNGGVDEVYLLDGSARVDSTTVDVDSATITLRGGAPVGTRVALRDAHGVPIETTTGSSEVDAGSGSWEAVVPFPAGDTRLYRIGVVTLLAGAVGGTTATQAVIPVPLTASVESSKPKKLVLTGRGEPGATVRFRDSAGSPLRDADGNTITVELGRSGLFTRTLDPRLVSGRTVVLTQEQAGRVLGRAAVVF
ncbi:hypothetical protein AS850_00395 [Frondihabitans sp. 762G35]|uniref:hypothetical protein n=1 Tax=Frondihabitans sp. 762G35 TaxID=1446794 RepID=UPI000D20AF01|nr:hypothetical protein [Frondihabitans sp. 762G35]ARC55534.1 hypothetical protein AS850_00395 [Frondihabitans sp. 762G35]